MVAGNEETYTEHDASSKKGSTFFSKSIIGMINIVRVEPITSMFVFQQHMAEHAVRNVQDIPGWPAALLKKQVVRDTCD